MKPRRTHNVRCNRCDISFDNNYTPVFGYGNYTNGIMLIGEAPGANEVKTGRPFTGAAGKKLNYILGVFDLKRYDVYMTNVVKCRPPRNRTPNATEIHNCFRYIEAELRYIKPQMIMLLGKTAVESFFKKSIRMSDARGKVNIIGNTIVMATYHPAFILRNPSYLEVVIRDFKTFFTIYASRNTNFNVNLDI